MKYNVPSHDRRACLCRDGSYSKKCCDPDDYFAQGIGSIHQGETDSAGTITQVDNTRTITRSNG